MKYRAAKACRFAKRYEIGQEIPESEIDANRAKALMKYGIIEIVPETPLSSVQDSGQTNTGPESESGSDGVKTALNSNSNGTEKKSAAKTTTRKSTTAKKPAARKGGK